MCFLVRKGKLGIFLMVRLIQRIPPTLIGLEVAAILLFGFSIAWK